MQMLLTVGLLSTIKTGISFYALWCSVQYLLIQETLCVGGVHVVHEYLLGMMGHIYHPSTGEVGQDNHKSKLFP